MSGIKIQWWQRTAEVSEDVSNSRWGHGADGRANANENEARWMD